jgi:hypothetical protein
MPRRISITLWINLAMTLNGKNAKLHADGRCELCGRYVGEDCLTHHHLLPRSYTRRMRRRKKGRRELKRRDPGQTVALCAPCHRNIHRALSNRDLGRTCDSLEALLANPDVRRFTEWVRDRPRGRM